MHQRSVIERVEILERKVEVLEALPERVTAVELQLVQLRDEMRAEFSATRAEMRASDEETRRYMRMLHEDVIARISMLDRPRRSRKESDRE
jgi:predicted phage gp36 major capsid-like protein